MRYRFLTSLFQSSDKADNPFLATQASPGMGKSSFIDVITGLSRKQIVQHSPKAATPAFIDAMCGAIHLVVDFNGYQTLSDFDTEHPTAGLAIRLLHTYVFILFWFEVCTCFECCV
jgi:hypothetical protein